MKFAYYPGCAKDSTARDMHESTMAVANALNIDLIELKGWICCGATAAHQTDRVLAVSLPAANLVIAAEMGHDMVTNCAACYNRMKTANYEVTTNTVMRERVYDILARDYDGLVKVRHFIEVLLEDVGLEKLRDTLKNSLNGLKVACYYGCLLVRPHKVTNFDDRENPMSMDHLVTAIGGESLDWPHKVECCGGGLSLTRTDIAIKLSGSILDMACAAGADCIAVSCPMCQANLDLRQKDIEKESDRRYDMPIVYITQLLGLCLGVSPGELGMNKLMVSPANIVKTVVPAV